MRFLGISWGLPNELRNFSLHPDEQVNFLYAREIIPTQLKFTPGNYSYVVEQPSGTRRIYKLHDQGVETVQAYVERIWGEAAVRFRIAAENTSARRRER